MQNPLFLMLVKGIESMSSIPYTFFVYTVQILIAFYAGVIFLRACGVTGKKIFLCWGSLALLTFPCAMQSHLAVLPNSPGYSFLLLELSAVIRILRQDAVAEDGETTAPDRPLHGLFEAGIWWALSTLCVVKDGEKESRPGTFAPSGNGGNFIHAGAHVADTGQLREGGEYGERRHDAPIQLDAYERGRRIR